MKVNDIRSVGWLHNHNDTITLSVCTAEWHTFITIPKTEFEALGGIEGINSDKQVVVDLYNKHGADANMKTADSRNRRVGSMDA